MAGVNDNDIIDRIIENLKHVPNDVFGSAATEPKFAKIVFGDAPNNNKKAEVGNIAYVRPGDKTIVSATRLGTKAARKVSNETREYWIIIVTKNKTTPEDALKELNTLTFKTKELLEKNRHLAKPDGTLPLAIDLTVFDVPRDVSMIGKELVSNTLILRYSFAIS